MNTFFGKRYFFAHLMTVIKKHYKIKLLLISIATSFIWSDALYAAFNLRLPMEGWKKRSSFKEIQATFNPQQKPISWTGSSDADKEKIEPVDDWTSAHRAPHDTLMPRRFRDNINNLIPEEIPYRDIIADALSYFSEIKGRSGICFIWASSACYILKDLPFVEEVKLLRTRDDKQTWLALKFKNSDEWYAFDRAIGQLARYSEKHPYGVYRPLGEAGKIAPYLTEEKSYELTYSSDDVLLKAVSGSSYAQNQIIALRRDARASFLKKYGDEKNGIYKKAYYKRIVGLLLSLVNDRADRGETISEIRSYSALPELEFFSRNPTSTDIAEALLRIKLILCGHKLYDYRTIWTHLKEAQDALEKWGDFDIVFHPRRYETWEIHTDTTLHGYTNRQVKQALRLYKVDPRNSYRDFSERLKSGGYDGFIGRPEFPEGKFNMLVPIEEYIDCVAPSAGNIREAAESAKPVVTCL